jgi:hypothetical protein
MMWFSPLASATKFASAVRKDPDMVFVSHAHKRMALTVSSAAEIDGNMAVFGPDNSWRVNVSKQGRRIVPVQLKVRSCKKQVDLNTRLRMNSR